MITITDSIEIEATPEQVFDWLVERFKGKDSNQTRHPDHVDIRWIKGESLQEGSIVYAEEYLHGRLYRLKLRVTKVVPNRVIEYKSLFPFSILAPGNAFLVEPKGENSCVFIATVGLRRLRLPRLPSRKRRKNGKHRIKAIQQHMKEEGENLKRALEKGSKQ